GDHAKVAREVRHLLRPERSHATEARHEQQRRPVARDLVVELGVTDGDLGHVQFQTVSFIPSERSMATTPAGRANGAGAGSPECRGRPIACKNVSSPGGVITHSITSSSDPSLTISCLTSWPRKHAVPGTSGWLCPSTITRPRPRKQI